MAWKTKIQTGPVHNNSCRMAFGRPSKHSTCPRCEDLKQGAEPRKGWNAHKIEAELRRRAAIKFHYSSGECQKKCGPVCTAFDW